jgi:hypothetical protein
VRVWGGGIIQSDVFYDALDAAGIMVYHDQVASLPSRMAVINKACGMMF